MAYQANDTTLALKDTAFHGNVVPPHWYKVLCFESGKPNFVAVTLLAEIVYWYRPTPVRDEASGRISGYTKKFKADFLQRSTKALEEQFGFSRKQVNDALNFLRDKGLIVRHFRDIEMGDMGKLTNVQFLELVPEAINHLQKTHDLLPPGADPLTCKCRPPSPQVTPTLYSTVTTTAATAATPAAAASPSCEEQHEPADSPDGSSSATLSRQCDAANPSRCAAPPQPEPRLAWILDYVPPTVALQLQGDAASKCYADGQQGYDLWRLKDRAEAMKAKGNAPRAAWFKSAIEERYDFGASVATSASSRDSRASEVPSWRSSLYTWLRTILGERIMITGDRLTLFEPDPMGIMVPVKALKLSKDGLKLLMHRLQQHYNEPRLAEIPAELLA